MAAELWKYVFLFFGFCAAVLFVNLRPRARQIRKYEAEIKAREPLPDDEMFARYFQHDEVAPDVPRVVRRVFARNFGLPTEKLLPDDDLTPFFVDLEMIYWIEDLETFFGISFDDEDAEQLSCNIRSVSRFVSQKLAE